MLDRLSWSGDKELGLLHNVSIAHEVRLRRTLLGGILPRAPRFVDGRVNDHRPAERHRNVVRFRIRADRITMMQDGVSKGGK
jgi:hypothetical protein